MVRSLQGLGKGGLIYGPPYYTDPPDTPDPEPWQESLDCLDPDEPIDTELEEMLPEDRGEVIHP